MKIFGVFCLSVFLALPAHAEDKPKSQCSGSETVIFRCDFGDKNLSVCELEDGKVSYRFGKPGEPEITIDGAALVSGRSYPGGGETRLRFSKGAYDYIVFDLIRYSGEYDEETGTHGMEDRAGVYVLKDKKRVATLDCTGFMDEESGKVITSRLKSKQKEAFLDFD